ncbi:MAG: serine hydrolase domain-containing protein [Planctomycetota bacterium]
MQRTIELLRQGIADGLHPGFQLCVMRGGEVVGACAEGEARTGVPMTDDTLMLWMSSGKPVTAVAVAQQVSAGRVELDTPVAEYIPGFEQGGKGAITVAHVLQHTGGFRKVGSNWSTEPWGKVIERLCAAELEPGWEVGEMAGYHVASGWYVLGEIVRRVDSHERPFEVYLRQEIFEKLNMDDSWVGMPTARYADYGTRIGMAWHTEKGEIKPMPFPHTQLGCTLCRPGGNARGPARELAGFYAHLLETRRTDPVLHAFTSRQRVGLTDRTFGAVIDWGHGFLINDQNGKRLPYGYGPHASPDTFGHSGNQSSCAFGDPEHDLAVAWITNGLPGEITHQRRQHALNAAIYEDLGLA